MPQQVPLDMPSAAAPRPMPMVQATGPVMMAGRTLSKACLPPEARMMKPTTTLMIAVAMKPAVTTEMASGGATAVSELTPRAVMIPATAVM